MEVDGESNQQDDYLKFKNLEKQLEHLDVMEEYVKLETRNLEKELLHAQEEVNFKINFQFHIWFLGEAYSICSRRYRTILGSRRSQSCNRWLYNR
jgi:hypothetical protein